MAHNLRTVDGLASKFYAEGRTDGYLTLRQSNWLRGLAIGQGAMSRTHGTPTIVGTLYNEAMQVIGGYTAYFSPINQCARFKVTTSEETNHRIAETVRELVFGLIIEKMGGLDVVASSVDNAMRFALACQYLKESIND